jgi:hypothetical protein
MTVNWHVNCFTQSEGVLGGKGSKTKACAMETYTPEFGAFWLGDPEPGGERPGAESGRDGLSPSQQVALEELAERVNAARSVV